MHMRIPTRPGRRPSTLAAALLVSAAWFATAAPAPAIPLAAAEPRGAAHVASVCARCGRVADRPLDTVLESTRTGIVAQPSAPGLVAYGDGTGRTSRGAGAHLPGAQASTDCGGTPATGGRGLSTAEPDASAGGVTPVCGSTDVVASTSSLDVLKNTTDDRALRPDAAKLTLSCDDGTSDAVEVAPGSRTGSMAHRTFTAPVSCAVTEPQTGAAPGLAVSATVLRTDGAGQSVRIALGEPFRVEVGERVTVTVSNAVGARSGTAPPPEAPGSPPPAASRGAGAALARTGSAAGARGLVAAGLLAVLTGCGVITATRRGRTR